MWSTLSFEQLKKTQSGYTLSRDEIRSVKHVRFPRSVGGMDGSRAEVYL
jgi:hypothetical protein